MTRSARRGWLGGTFDPIHCGHLDVARVAREALGLTQVTLVPARVPPHRPQPTASAADRAAMAHLAAADSWLDVSTIELEGQGPSYTATTMDRLEALGVDLRTLVVITGADAFVGILSWHRVDDLLNRVSFAVVSRPGYPAPELRRALPALAPRMMEPEAWLSTSHPGIVLVDAPTAPVSSTQVREEIAAGRTLTGLVPQPVEAYIAAHGLYGTQKERHE